MRLGFRYADGHANGEGFVPSQCEVYNAETGEPIEMVTNVAFRMSANDMVPHLSIECIPSRVQFNDDGGVETRVIENGPEGVHTFPTRERVVDLDGNQDQDDQG